MILLSGCNNGGASSENMATPHNTKVGISTGTNYNNIQAPAKIESSILWTTCQDNPAFMCSNLSVPVDYNNLNKGYIQLPVTIHYATGNKLGTLVFKFGAPWANDVLHLHEFFPSLTKTLQDNYDLVSFVPRGVAPNPAYCDTSNINFINVLQWGLNLNYFDSTSSANTMYTGTWLMQSLCSFTPLTNYSGSKNTIRDIDMFRQALGVNKINYLGLSYGSHLGLAYLIEYPNHVDKMVLDSNPRPNNDFATDVTRVAFGNENVFHRFFQACVDAGSIKCALYQESSIAIEDQYQSLISQTTASGGIPTSSTYNNRLFTPAMLSTVTTTIFGTPEYWPEGAAAIHEAITKNNADPLMELYIEMTGYTPATNTFPFVQNVNEVWPAVVCKDFYFPNSYSSQSGWTHDMSNLLQEYPNVGGTMAIKFGNVCIGWTAPSDPLLPDATSINTSATVLLVGDRYDPITPLSSTKDVSYYLNQLMVTNKVLAWDGVGHESYSYSSPTGGCIDQNVDNFFATGVLPTIDTCTDNVNPFLYQNPSAKEILKDHKQYNPI